MAQTIGGWRLNRTDGPAAITDGGSVYWYRNGDFHRENGPAIERSDGLLVWYREGGRHREDGPASIYGQELGWYLDGDKKGFYTDSPIAQLRAGGRLIKRRTTTTVEDPAGYYQLVDLHGIPVTPVHKMPRAAWLNWLEANAAEYLPAFEAALRAKAMKSAMRSVIAPATPRRVVAANSV